MAKVLGVGGVFFKAKNREKLGRWYQEALNFEVNPSHGSAFVPTAMPKGGITAWSPFADDTTYFAPSEKPFMFNLVVDDLDGALTQVKAAGAEVVGGIDEHEYGRFGWFMDPDGNKVELWEPCEMEGKSL